MARGMRRRDNSAFSDVYDAVAPLIFDQMLTLTEDSALAEELTQRVLLRLHKARGRFLRQADVGAWSLAIAERVAVENALGLDAPTPSLLACARRAFEALCRSPELTKPQHRASLPAVTSLPIILEQPDCQTYPCKEECCSAGVDVWPEERQRIIDAGHGRAEDFTGPERDEEDDLLYRTALGAPRPRLPSTDARLPLALHRLQARSLLRSTARDSEEVDELREYGMLPCHAHWKWKD